MSTVRGKPGLVSKPLPSVFRTADKGVVCVATGLELTVLLLHPPKGWDRRPGPAYLTDNGHFEDRKLSCRPTVKYFLGHMAVKPCFLSCG